MKKLTRVEKKRKRRRIIFRLFLLIVIAFSIGIYAINSDFFLIKNITVLGNNKLSKENIITAVPINIGENILRISIKEGEKSLLKLPYIKEIKVKRKFPRDILINIVERKEIAQIKRDFSLLLVDEEGYILDVINEEKEKLPIFHGISVGNLKAGESLNLSEDIGHNLDFIKEANIIGILTKMDEIYMVDNNNVSIVLNNSINVAFGTINNVEYKLKLLNEVLKDIEKKQLSCKMILMDKGDNPIIVLNEE
ncbi:MAG: FtsQ-type POTRA domain-containing protein [Tissierellaceae bacterium]